MHETLSGSSTRAGRAAARVSARRVAIRRRMLPGAAAARGTAAAGRVPFFHVGADEPLDLGRGRRRAVAAQARFAAHVTASRDRRAAGARPMIWDDAVQPIPRSCGMIPKRTVIVDFHYGAEPSFAPYIATVDRARASIRLVLAGREQLERDLRRPRHRLRNAAQFLADAKAAHSPHVLGMFDTVWHDDGESLYEATWAPLAFAAATAWQAGPVDRARGTATFARSSSAMREPRPPISTGLRAIPPRCATQPETDPPDYLFWADPFDPRIGAHADARSGRRSGCDAEAILEHLAAQRAAAQRARRARDACWRRCATTCWRGAFKSAGRRRTTTTTRARTPTAPTTGSSTAASTWRNICAGSCATR